MVLTSSGPSCDVCGQYILLDKSINWFTVDGCLTRLCCHDSCKEIVLDANDDWQKLPSGPLRKMFEDDSSNSSGDS